MIKARLKGKQVKDYIFGDALVVFQQGSQVAQATKSGKMNLTVYGVANTLIDPNTFPIYNNQIVENQSHIYPAYYQIVRSQNFLYMIFQEVTKPHVNSNSVQQIQKFISQLQRLFYNLPNKLIPEQVFMKSNGTHELCIIVPYVKNLQKTSNLYSKYHNKAILAEIFCQTVNTKNNESASQIFIQNIQSQNLFSKLLPHLNLPENRQQIKNINKVIPRTQNTQWKNTGYNQTNPWNKQQVTKSKANNLIKQMQQQYPQIDQKQFEQLMAYVQVNPNLKKQAGQTYLRQSAKVRKQQAQDQICEIVNNVNTTLFNVTSKKLKDGKSKVEIKLNKKNMQATEFQVHFEALYSQFVLFKKTIRSYLDRYRNGFAGIIAAYLITLIGILRRLKIYTELQSGIDIFQIGGSVNSMDFSKFLNVIRKDLAQQARNLVNLKNIIQNANMPYKTYEALTPFLDEDLENIDLQQTQKFCFFYMTVLIKMGKGGHSYHDLLALEVMYILINPTFSIVYSQDDMPQSWDKNSYQMKKILISALVPSWNI